MYQGRDLRTLSQQPGSVARCGAALHVVGLRQRGRNTRAAELLGLAVRTVRRAAERLRAAGLRMPPAPPGRPPRTDYSGSRRGRRRRRNGRSIDPVELAATSLGRPDDVRQLQALIRHLLDLWPPARFPHHTPIAAARAIGTYLAQGGQLGPEAERWFRLEVRTLPLERTHTPWAAAVAEMHLKPWLAQRRAAELRAREQAIQDARRAAPVARLSDEEYERLRLRARGRGS